MAYVRRIMRNVICFIAGHKWSVLWIGEDFKVEPLGACMRCGRGCGDKLISMIGPQKEPSPAAVNKAQRAQLLETLGEISEGISAEIQRAERNANEGHSESIRRNEVFIACGLRMASAVVARHELKLILEERNDRDTKI